MRRLPLRVQDCRSAAPGKAQQAAEAPAVPIGFAQAARMAQARGAHAADWLLQQARSARHVTAPALPLKHARR